MKLENSNYGRMYSFTDFNHHFQFHICVSSRLYFRNVAIASKPAAVACTAALVPPPPPHTEQSSAFGTCIIHICILYLHTHIYSILYVHICVSWNVDVCLRRYFKLKPRCCWLTKNMGHGRSAISAITTVGVYYVGVDSICRIYIFGGDFVG